MVYRNVKTIKQNLVDSLIWRIWFLHLATGFNIIYPCLLKYSQGKLDHAKTLTLAGDMQWTYTPSSTIPLSNFNFSSHVFREKLNVSQTKHYLL